MHLEAQFRAFETAILQPYRTGDWSILEHPVLHIYVTDCCDVDAYKTTIKEEIDGWLRTLQSHGGITDWMILLVETVDSKKTKNLLPRTTVLDKMRLDFGTSKHGADRCVSVLNPIKYEVRATESFRCLLNRMRSLMLVGFNRNICKYEELIRSHREKRQQEGWCYVRHFLLQEQLAVVLEMLGLHQEALVQYDELEAMFGQFVLNAARGERPPWLRQFEERPLHQFHGITMYQSRMAERRALIETGSATVLEFRSYVFERQTVLLAAANEHWEIAERFLPFVYGTLREVDVLLGGGGLGGNVASGNTVDGALACWQFVSACEVLALCDDAVAADAGRDATNIFQYTAGIWNMAKERLYELGELCGLLPGRKPTSEQLHIVVQLSAGIGDAVHDERAALVERSRDRSPARGRRAQATERLREALGSGEAFTKLYLELSELAISTYKHVARLRSARLVGLDLGRYYCALGEPQKAVVFFADLVRELKTERWSLLFSETLLQLAGCYRQMADFVAYTKTCASIACCAELEMLVRTFHFDEFLRAMSDLKKDAAATSVEDSAEDKEVAILTTLEDHFALLGVRVVLGEESTQTIMQDDVLCVEIELENHFPREIVASELALSYELVDKDVMVDSTASTDALSAYVFF